jgi:hypothetical protein
VRVGVAVLQLPKLCSLDVSFNKITSLRNVSTARELRELKIYNNKLTNTIGLKAYVEFVLVDAYCSSCCRANGRFRCEGTRIWKGYR